MEGLARHSFLSSPLGWLRTVERDNTLVSLSFVDRPQPSLALGKVAQQLAGLLASYFDGDSSDFATITLSMTTGSVFQQQVWQTLRKIPYGQTVSYRQVAEAIDRPSAYRAVARAIADNPLIIIVPCHRVVYSDGKLGGYVGGIERKQQLLRMEQLATRNREINQV